jgi:hypothetical protein
MRFAEQMRYALITDAVLCSAPKEGGNVTSPVELECAKRFLIKLIEGLPNATIAALGRKAQNRLRRAKINGYISAFAAAPPGCNFRGAKESWKQIADKVNRGR